MKKIKIFIINLLIDLNLWNYKNESYSQEGEDLILKRYFENVKKGFYVDVGAHHPFRFSNTYIFYKMGWRGINIDAMPGSMVLFNRFRKRDINVECAVSNRVKEIEYYKFDEPALNSFDEKMSKKREEESSYKILETVSIKSDRLDNILDKHLSRHEKEIDFLTIDVEGFDYKVLTSINLTMYQPKLILFECVGGVEKIRIEQYLYKYGYRFYAKTVNTYFYEKI